MNDDPNALAWNNRRILAERLKWPTGALEVCEQLETENPEWSISYSKGGGSTWKGAGFYAQRKAAWRPEPALYGRTAQELDATIRAWQPPPTYGIRTIETTDRQASPEIVGSHEIGERIGLDHKSVEEIIRQDSFPPPVANLAQGSVWLASDVKNWIRAHRPDIGN